MNTNVTINNLLSNSFIPRLPPPHIYKKIIAFTLAEVLITLLIIGIVSSLVIPNLIADTQQAELITAWKKAYGVISQAQLNMIRDYGSVSGTFSNIDSSTLYGPNNLMNEWLPYLMVTKKCNSQRVIPDGCHIVNFKALDGSPITSYNTYGGAGIVLNDGTFINFYHGSVCDDRLCNDSYLFIDVNGTKGPNTFGKDVFVMRYSPSKDRFIPGIGTKDPCAGTGFNCGVYYLSQ